MLGQLFDRRTGLPVEANRYQEWTRWDRRSLGASITAGTTYNFFSREGGVDYRDTNINTASRMPSGTEVLILTIQVTAPAGITDGDLALLMDNGVLYVYQSQRTSFEAPLQHCHSGTGMVGETTNTATEWVTLGMPSPMAVYQFESPLVVVDQEEIQIRLNFPDATTLSAARVVEIFCRTLEKSAVH